MFFNTNNSFHINMAQTCIKLQAITIFWPTFFLVWFICNGIFFEHWRRFRILSLFFKANELTRTRSLFLPSGSSDNPTQMAPPGACYFPWITKTGVSKTPSRRGLFFRKKSLLCGWTDGWTVIKSGLQISSNSSMLNIILIYTYACI